MDTISLTENNKLLSELNHLEQAEFFNAVKVIKKTIAKAKTTLEVLFTSTLSLAHTAKQIDKIETTANTLLVSQNIFGIINLYSILPSSYLEIFSANHDRLKSFIKIVDHLLTDKFYQSWCRAHFYTDYSDESFSQYPSYNIVKSVISHDKTKKYLPCNEENKPPEILQFFSGESSKKDISRRGLEALLNYYFSLEIKVIENYPQQVSAESNSLLKISSEKSNRQYNRLGIDSLLGKKSWNSSQSVLIQIESTDFKDYLDFNPSSKKIKLLEDMVRQQLGNDVNFSTNAIINNNSITPYRLTYKKDRNEMNKAGHLGFSTWLTGKKHQNTIKLKSTGN
jgi:predicted component of type VI protein secretion system